MDIVTRPADSSDLPAAAEVLADAFSDYPWTRWTVSAVDHRQRLVALQHLALEHFGLAYGTVSVTTVDGELCSVAAWTDSDAIKSVEIDPLVAARTAQLEGDRHAVSLAAEDQIAPFRPDGRHLDLGTVGTTAVWQGRGLASKTLAPLLRAGDEEGLEIWLETSSQQNVAFYLNRGFAVDTEVEIDGGGPPVWVMVRAAA